MQQQENAEREPLLDVKCKQNKHTTTAQDRAFKTLPETSATIREKRASTRSQVQAEEGHNIGTRMCIQDTARAHCKKKSKPKAAPLLVTKRQHRAHYSTQHQPTCITKYKQEARYYKVQASSWQQVQDNYIQPSTAAQAERRPGASEKRRISFPFGHHKNDRKYKSFV